MPINRKLLAASPGYGKKLAQKLVTQKSDLARQLSGLGPLPVIVGLHDGRNAPFVHNGTDFLYVDHAYFCKDRNWDRVRIVRRAHHLNRVLPRPGDRLKKWNVRIDPWRRPGRTVVVIPPSFYYESLYGLQSWLPLTLERLARATDRRVVVKVSKGGFQEFLSEHDTHAVVCAMSVAGVESALLGYPVFSGPLCASYPISSGSLDDIDRPQYPERYPWACSLAYASWGLDELDLIDWTDYNYQYKGANASSDNGQ